MYNNHKVLAKTIGFAIYDLANLSYKKEQKAKKCSDLRRSSKWKFTATYIRPASNKRFDEMKNLCYRSIQISLIFKARQAWFFCRLCSS